MKFLRIEYDLQQGRYHCEIQSQMTFFITRLMVLQPHCSFYNSMLLQQIVVVAIICYFVVTISSQDLDFDVISQSINLQITYRFTLSCFSVLGLRLSIHCLIVYLILQIIYYYVIVCLTIEYPLNNYACIKICTMMVLAPSSFLHTLFNQCTHEFKTTIFLQSKHMQQFHSSPLEE